ALPKQPPPATFGRAGTLAASADGRFVAAVTRGQRVQAGRLSLWELDAKNLVWTTLIASASARVAFTSAGEVVYADATGLVLRAPADGTLLRHVDAPPPWTAALARELDLATLAHGPGYVPVLLDQG